MNAAPPPALPYAGWPKWRSVALQLGLAVLLSAVAGVIFAIPDAPAALLVVGAYVAFTIGLLLVTAVVDLRSRRLPSVVRSEVGGQAAVGVQARRVEWWPRLASNAADTVGLVLLGVLGFRAGGEAVPLAVVAWAVAIWPLGRVGLALAGRRHRDALWVTAEEVIGLGGDGVRRCTHGDVTKVVAGTENGTVFVVASRVRRHGCPRPWRGRAGWADDEIGIDCGLTAHDPDGLAAWLRAQIGVPDHTAPGFTAS